MSGGGKGGNSGPSESKIKDAMIYPELRDPAFRAIQDAKRLYAGGYKVPELNRRSQEGVEATEDWAAKFGSAIDEPLEYATWLSQGKGVGKAPGQDYLQGIYQQGAGTAGYGMQEQIAGNLMRGNGAGFGMQEDVARTLQRGNGAGYGSQEGILRNLTGNNGAGYGTQEGILRSITGGNGAGYGTQESILRNLTGGNGAGFGSQEQILNQAMGDDNLGYIQNTAAGGQLGGNPHLEGVLGEINRGTTQAYQNAIGSLEGGMSRAGQMGGSVESQLKARENEGLAKQLAANESSVRYGDYSQERGYQQQAGMALPGAYAQQLQTRQGAAGQLNDMEARRLGLQQGAAGQLNDMEARRLGLAQGAAGQLNDMEARRLGLAQGAAGQLNEMQRSWLQQQQGAAGQLNDMEARRIGMQQGAAGQLGDMQYRKLQAEMQAAEAAGAGYRQDIGQAMGAGQMMPALGGAGFGVGQELRAAGDYTRENLERTQNADWESLSRFIDMNKGVAGLMSGSPGAAQQQQPAGQGMFNNAMGVAGLGLKAYGMGLFSDRRLKTDIEPVGHGLYRWRYIWGGPLYEGPMAQDVLEVAPELVRTVAGYLAIPASMIREVG